MFVRYCSPCLPMFFRWLMLSGPVELLFLLFLIAVCTSSSVYSPLSYVVVVDLPLLRVAVEGSDNPIFLERPCQGVSST